MNEQEFVFRPYTLEDRPFIESSWASSYYSACRIKDLLSPEEFHSFHRPLRERFFSRPSATVIVAADEDDPTHIFGWIAVEVVTNATLLHYIYVKSTYRKEYGISKKLLIRGLPPGDVLYTHITPKFAKILCSDFEYFKRFRYLPHLT